MNRKKNGVDEFGYQCQEKPRNLTDVGVEGNLSEKPGCGKTWKTASNEKMCVYSLYLSHGILIFCRRW